jgi:hypothetical protein
MSEQEISRSKSARLILLMLVLVQILAVGVLAYARLGDPWKMPDQLFRLAQKLGNPRTKPEVPHDWVRICQAWDSWLGVLQREGPRLLRTDDLWGPNDPLRVEIANFAATANELRPATLVPEAASEKNLRVLAESPPEPVRNELQYQSALERVHNAGRRITLLMVKLETWPKWQEMHSLLRLMQDRGFTRTATALQPRLPRERRDGYRVNTVRTLKLLNDISRDDSGTLLLLKRWSEFTHLAAEMKASGDPEQVALPGLVLSRLTDQPSLAEFADSLSGPLEEMRRRRK